MAILNFSINGESFDDRQLRLKSKKFDLNLHNTNNKDKAKNFNHAIYSIDYLSKVDCYVSQLNALLHKAAADEGISVVWLSITVTGHLAPLIAQKNNRKKDVRNIDITVKIFARAKESQLQRILFNARKSAPPFENNKQTQVNYSINSVIHLN
jgi:hypothetical protein